MQLSIIKRISMRSISLILVSFFILSAGSCTKNENQTILNDNQQTHSKIKIGLSMGTLQEERWQRDRDIFVARATELGATVIVQNANSDNNDQANQVQYLLKQGINVLVIVPTDAEKSKDIVESARNSGVKIISYDRLVRNANVDLYISFDNVKVGELMAESLVDKVPKGNYVIINGARTDNNVSMFNEGYKNVLTPYVNKGDIKIIKEIYATDWLPEEAYNCIEGIIESNTKMDAVIAGNDNLATAVIEALSENRLTGKVLVVGHDADLSGCQRVVEGTQLMTIYKPIDQIAKTAAEFAIKIARSEPIKANSTIFDGTNNVPYYKITPIAVTKTNMMDTVIKDSFHSIKDVYRNLPQSQWPTK